MDDLTKKLLRRLAETVLDVLREDAPHKTPWVQAMKEPAEKPALPQAQAAPALAAGDVVRVWDGNKWAVATVSGVVNRGKDKGKVRAFVARAGKRNKNLLLNANDVFPLNKEGAK